MDESDTFTLDTSQEKNEREKEDFFEKKSKTVVYWNIKEHFLI